MRFLADENIPASLVKGLRSAGHDVNWANDSLQGAKDSMVLDAALVEERILVTLDKEFAGSAYRQHAARLSGLVLLRLDGLKRDEFVRTALSVICARSDWAGNFAIIGNSTVRTRRLRS